jgi:hypothetical protein
MFKILLGHCKDSNYLIKDPKYRMNVDIKQGPLVLTYQKPIERTLFAGVANNNWYLLKIPDFFWVEKMVDKKTKKMTDLKLQSILNVNTNILLNFLFSFVSLFY